jgi:hypothetical protein
LKINENLEPTIMSPKWWKTPFWHQKGGFPSFWAILEALRGLGKHWASFFEEI